MARPGDDVEPAVADAAGQQAGVADRHHRVVVTGHDQRGLLELVEPRKA